MSREEMLEQELQLLGAALAPESSFVDAIMSRVVQTQIAPPGATVPGQTTRLLPRLRIAVAAVCVIVLALFLAWPFGGPSDPGAGARWLGSSSLYAQELVAVLDKVRIGGVIAREQTTFLMADGSQHPSSTSSIFFMSKDRYRYDIYDEEELRETQWYVPDGAGMTQTSLRVKSKTYQTEKHPESSASIDRVAQLRAVVKSVDRADRRFGPEEIEGIQCIGFEIAAAKVPELNSEGTYRVWFNSETKLPVRIETEIPKLKESAGLPGIRGMIIAFDHFEWGPRRPASTFTPQIPEGFQEAQN